MIRPAILSLAFLCGLALGHTAVAADAATGAALAQRWCASCHLIGESGAGSTPQGPPSFRAIASSGITDGQLRAFLSHPHGAMPDLALTRAEIEDLTSYIASLGK